MSGLHLGWCDSHEGGDCDCHGESPDDERRFEAKMNQQCERAETAEAKLRAAREILSENDPNIAQMQPLDRLTVAIRRIQRAYDVLAGIENLPGAVVPTGLFGVQYQCGTTASGPTPLPITCPVHANCFAVIGERSMNG